MIRSHFISENMMEAMHDYFTPLQKNPDRSFVERAELLEREARIENHPFFIKAKSNKKAMLVWASQEAIVTNPFSQILFRLISNIRNVHIRSILLPVVHGEHSRVRNGTAHKSHPWLIWRLCRSLGLSESDLIPTKAVVEFIKVLEGSTDNPMYALGVLGIGNELILLAEYRAVKACFDSTFPEADYEDFLLANIGEDEVHSKLIGDAAAALGALGYNRDNFVEGARDGIAARIAYYDALLEGIA